MEDKVFRKVKEQIGILRGRGVIINNKKFAKNVLLEINYYNLINGYKKIFLDETLPYEHYLSGTTFEEIYNLYEFDRRLRILSIEAILKVEKKFKTIIAYEFSRKYGYKNYLLFENFDISGSNPKSCKQISELFKKLYEKISLNIDKEQSITHYVTEKNYIPLWVLVNSLTIGDISKFYANMLPKDKNNVARTFKYGLRADDIDNCIYFLSSIRNRCAHDEVLFSFKSNVHLKNNNKYLKYFKLKKSNDYYAAMIALKTLLLDKDYNLFQKNVELLLDELSGRIHSISKNKVTSEMGMPSNWKKLKKLD